MVPAGSATGQPINARNNKKIWDLQKQLALKERHDSKYEH